MGFDTEDVVLVAQWALDSFSIASPIV
jgi:hypothetical protein